MNKVVFLDRDGTINVDNGYVHLIKDWEFTPGAIEALKKFRSLGFKLAVVTNQSGIEGGLYALEDMKRVHEHMQAELKKDGVELDYIAYCPHARDGECDCRKPRTGMAKQIEAALGPIDYDKSWMIGDKPADLGFGKNIGTRVALIRSRFWTEEELMKSEQQPDLVVENLKDAADKIEFELLGG